MRRSYPRSSVRTRRSSRPPPSLSTCPVHRRRSATWKGWRPLPAKGGLPSPRRLRSAFEEPRDVADVAVAAFDTSRRGSNETTRLRRLRDVPHIPQVPSFVCLHTVSVMASSIRRRSLRCPPVSPGVSSSNATDKCGERATTLIRRSGCTPFIPSSEVTPPPAKTKYLNSPPVWSTTSMMSASLSTRECRTCSGYGSFRMAAWTAPTLSDRNDEDPTFVTDDPPQALPTVVRSTRIAGSVILSPRCIPRMCQLTMLSGVLFFRSVELRVDWFEDEPIPANAPFSVFMMRSVTF
jgi:hypothetical protein